MAALLAVILLASIPLISYIIEANTQNFINKNNKQDSTEE